MNRKRHLCGNQYAIKDETDDPARKVMRTDPTTLAVNVQTMDRKRHLCGDQYTITDETYDSAKKIMRTDATPAVSGEYYDETLIGEKIDIRNCRCSEQRKQDNNDHRNNRGVAVYENVNGTITSFQQADDKLYSSSCSEIGELSVAHCKTVDNVEFALVSVYISPNHTTIQAVRFLEPRLILYTARGAKADVFNENYDKMPMILSGNFNMNLNDESSSFLIRYLSDELQLTANSKKDAVFSRLLDDFKSKVYVAHDCCHKSAVESENKLSIEDVMEVE